MPVEGAVIYLTKEERKKKERKSLRHYVHTLTSIHLESFAAAGILEVSSSLPFQVLDASREGMLLVVVVALLLTLLVGWFPSANFFNENHWKRHALAV